jgi:hypothetical protein
MTGSQPMTFSTRLVMAIALGCSALLAGTATAEVYQCKLKNGKVEMRDFPCDASTRPAAPISQQSPQPTTRPNPANSPSYGSPQGFANIGQYEAARRVCTRLMDQYDFTAPMMRCGLEDSNCFRRANQESSAIFQRLTALPEWKQQQCDLVLQVEGAAANGNQKSFEVVGAVRGCKYFVAEQGPSYSLVEEWMCFRPSRGDTGYGDISTFGIKEVKLNGLACSVYVDDWSLGRSRAADKLRDKCQ